MKATELQVGDWIKIGECDNYHGFVGKIAAINSITNYCIIRVRIGDDIFVQSDVLIDDIEPIPLTPEILEKNGWKEAQYWHEYQDGKNTIQSCLPDMRGIINGVEIQHFNCEYVHQYQHLPRLCGLNDLADNFIIE